MKMKQEEAMHLIGRLLVDLGEELRDGLMLFGLVLMLVQLFCLTDYVDKLRDCCIFCDFLKEKSNGLHFEIVIAANDTNVGWL